MPRDAARLPGGRGRLVDFLMNQFSVRRPGDLTADEVVRHRTEAPRGKDTAGEGEGAERENQKESAEVIQRGPLNMPVMEDEDR